jgi:putative CocE/NonD family hydrolase
MAPVNRGVTLGLVDRLVAMMNKLPAETCTYTVERVRIPLEDDVFLLADLYKPVGIKPLGTLLIRSPYGIGLAMSIYNARPFAARGYQVLYSNCRGTGGSGGQFEPAVNEAADGQATVAWMKGQPWYSGKFAMFGASYVGFVQWAILEDKPEDMKTAIINTAPIDFYKIVWGTGVFNSLLIVWADTTASILRDSYLKVIWAIATQHRRIDPVIDSVPFLENVQKFFRNEDPAWLRQMISTPDKSDAYWTRMHHNNAVERVDIPILLTAGWYDVVLEQVLAQYERLSERGCNVALTVGPWSHLSAGRGIMTETLDCLDTYLSGHKESNRSAPVRIYITGSNQWRDLPKWPPSSTPLEFFLGPGKKLGRETPTAESSDSTFTFNPKDPTPSLGVPELFSRESKSMGINTALTKRSDVVVFTTDPLDGDIEVCGRPHVELHHSSNHRHVDLWVVLNEIDKQGVSRMITETFLRLDISRDSNEPLKLVLDGCGHSFRKGNTISLLIAGGSHPRFIRNMGTAEDSWTATTFNPAKHSISHKASAISKLVLPVTAPGEPTKTK